MLPEDLKKRKEYKALPIFGRVKKILGREVYCFALPVVCKSEHTSICYRVVQKTRFLALIL